MNDGAEVIGDQPSGASIEVGLWDANVSGTTIVNNGFLGLEGGDLSISGIRVYGSGSSVVNAGSIATAGYGIALLPHDLAVPGSVESIINTGSISGDLIGVYVNGGETIQIENFEHVGSEHGVGIYVEGSDIVSILNGPDSSVLGGLGIGVNLSVSSPTSSQVDIVQGRSSTVSAFGSESEGGKAIFLRSAENAEVTLQAGTTEAPTTISANGEGVRFEFVRNASLEMQADSRIIVEGPKASNAITINYARNVSVTIGEGALIQAPGAGMHVETTEALIRNDGRILTTGPFFGQGIEVYILEGVSQNEYGVEVINNGDIVLGGQGRGISICCSGTVLVENHGSILADKEWGAGIYFASSGQIVNESTITSGRNASAVQIESDGPQRATLINRGYLLSVGGGTEYLDEGTRDGVPLETGYGTFTQYGVFVNNGTVINEIGGTIEVTDDISSAIRMTRSETDSSVLENYGMIFGNDGRLSRFDDRDSDGAIVRRDRFVYGAVDGGPGVDTVVNAGVISGSIGLAGNADSLTNTGLIGGDVNLGDGDDTITLGAGSRIVGTIEGGAGSDTITSMGDGSLKGKVDIEGLRVEGGILQAEFSAGSRIGVTRIDGGALMVEGSVETGAAVFEDGILGGNGTLVANTLNEGTVSPGNSIGTLTIDGNYTQTSTGELFVELDGTAADKLAVTGAATLDGVLTAGLIARDLNTLEGKSYTVLTAGSIAGALDTTGTVQQGFWTLDVQQTGTSVTVTVTDVDVTIGASVPFTTSLSNAVAGAAPPPQGSGGIVFEGVENNPLAIDDQQSTSLDYDSMGDWETTAASFTGNWTTLGDRTPATSMPKTGTAEFEGTTRGELTETGAPEAFVVEGNVMLTADFAKGLVNADFTGMEKIDSRGVVSAWIDFRARMSIADGTSEFAGTAGTDDGVWNGEARGGFFGDDDGMPGHAAGLWSISSPLGRALGGFTAKRQ